jgi:hypothetical protein
MKSRSFFWALLIIIFIFVIPTIVWLGWLAFKDKSNDISIIEEEQPIIHFHDSSPTIYCIMTTGKTPNRIQYAKHSLQNFFDQTYTKKCMIIINQGDVSVLSDDFDNVIEVFVEKDKYKLTLGDMRNIALSLVAIDAYWTTWDDDDWRDMRYLATLMSYYEPHHNTVIAITKRLEYNVNNKASWVGNKPSGFVFFAAPKDMRVQYLSKDSMEDVTILDQYRALSYNVLCINNSHMLYVRIVHQNNTSEYVNMNKSYLIKGNSYSENPTSVNDKMFLDNLITSYFWFL